MGRVMPSGWATLSLHRTWLACLTLLSVVFFSPLVFADCKPWTSSENIEESTVIGNINIVIKNVFQTTNENENSWLHRSANYLHIKTRKAVIESQLLFKVGDVYDTDLLIETERLLRANRYIKSAKIYPTRSCDGKVEIQVVTTDSWTLTPGLSFGRAGGVNHTSISVEEHNLLGYGNELTFNTQKGSERTQDILKYKDNNLFSERYTLSIEYQDNSDGQAYGFSTGLPFFQFAGQHAWNLSASSVTQENAIYEAGQVTDSVGREDKQLNGYYAWAEPETKRSVNRYRAGWAYHEAKTFQSLNYPGSDLPEDAVYSSPYFGWQHNHQNYIEVSNLFGVEVIEDISIGYNADIQLGWINDAWGSTDDFLSLAATYSRGYQPGKTQLMLWNLNINGLFGNSRNKDVTIKAHADWFLFHNNRSRLHLFSLIEAGSELSSDQQLTIGGDTGLLGYPLKYQSGNRKFLFSLEDRYFFEWYPLHLLKTGVSLFANFGAAWDSATENRHTLRDVGFGFLLASTRQSTRKIAHIYFAFPLDDNDQVDGFQVVIGAESEF
jgi:outer membrane protein assembly factor BamA